MSDNAMYYVDIKSTDQHPIWHFNLEKVKEHIMNGGDINEQHKDWQDRTFLTMAIYANNLEMVTWLLQHDAKLIGIDEFTMIMLACNLKYLDILNVIMTNQRYNKGDLLRTLTIANNQIVITNLIESGFMNVDSKDQLNRTALMAACTVHNQPLVEYFLKMGANIHARDDQFMTPILYCNSQDGLDAINVINILNILVDHGANLYDQDASGQNSIAIYIINAAKCVHTSIIKWLIDHHCAVNGHGSIMESPLALAINKGSYRTVELLVLHGAKFSREHIMLAHHMYCEYPRSHRMSVFRYLLDRHIHIGWK